MNALKPLYLLLIPLVLIVAIGSFFAQKHLENSEYVNDELSSFCTLVNGRCELATSHDKLIVSFSPEPEIEETLSIELSGGATAKIKSVHIQGVNMFMGKIPVVVENQSANNWTGWTMLGACSEPKMQWKMVVSYADTTQSIIFFSTQI